MSRTMPLEQAVEEIGAPSVRWLAEQIRAGVIPARKIGRSVRMTDADIEAALEVFKTGRKIPAPVESEAPRPLSFTPASQRRRSAS